MKLGLGIVINVGFVDMKVGLGVVWVEGFVSLATRYSSMLTFASPSS
jgi:hypothetical protein